MIFECPLCGLQNPMAVEHICGGETRRAETMQLRTETADPAVTALRAQLAAATKRAEKAEQGRDRRQQWIDDLHSGMYINCVYCGHRYGPSDNTPVSMAEMLKQHIEVCPEHPCSILKAENTVLRAKIAVATERMEKAEGLVRQYEAVESSWDAQAVAKELALPLASDIRAEILPAVVKLKQERDLARAQLCATRGALVDVKGYVSAAQSMGWVAADGHPYLCATDLERIAERALATPAPPCPHAAALATEERRVLALAIQVAATNSQAVVETLSVEGIIAEHDARIRAEERAKTVAILDRCAPYLRMEWRNASMSYCAGVADLERMLRAEFADGAATSQVQTLARETKDDGRPDGGGEA